MAWWSRENKREAEDNASDAEAPKAADAPEVAEATEGAQAPTAAGDAEQPNPGTAHDPVAGDMGPFDGDSVDIAEFDFTDFATGVLNLGSLKIPLPKGSQVQVEMGDKGPKMLHIVTTVGRITPVAFAAPRSGGQWRQAVNDITENMRSEGLSPEVVAGPWGNEIVSVDQRGTLRIIGVDGPRWMARFTLASPNDRAEKLAELAREVLARTFVYRGDAPLLAGNSLPVALPKQLADQVQQALAQRNAQQALKAQQASAAPAAPQQQPPTQQPDGPEGTQQ